MYCYSCQSFNCGHAIGQLANNNRVYPGLATQITGTTNIVQDRSTWVTTIMPRQSEAVIKAELEVCKIDSLIAEKEQKIQEYASEYPINFDKLIDAIDDLELVSRRKEQFEKIIEEMFSEDQQLRILYKTGPSAK